VFGAYYSNGEKFCQTLAQVFQLGKPKRGPSNGYFEAKHFENIFISVKPTANPS